MNKKQILKLKRQLNSTVMDLCSDNPEFLAEKIEAVLEDHFTPKPVKKEKAYLASTGETEKMTMVVRTKGQSQKADASRGVQ